MSAAAVSLRRRYISAGGWATLSRVIAALAGFGTNLLIARLLTPQNVGTYFLLVSAVTLAVSLSQGGLQLAVVRMSADALAKGLSGRARDVIETALRIGLAMAFAIALAVALVGGAIGVNSGSIAMTWTTFALVGGWVVAMSLMSLTSEFLRGLHEYRMAALTGGALSNVLSVGGLWLLLALAVQVDLDALLSVVVTVVSISGLIGLRYLSRRLSELGPKLPTPVSDLLAIGWPLQMTSLAIFGMSQLDIWLVAAYCGTQEVALYGAAARLLALVVMPMLIGNAILQPLIADVHGRGDQLLMQRLGSITATISSGIAVVALAAIWMAAGSILAVAYGDYYREAADILIVLCAGQTLNVLAGPGAVVLMMSGGQKDVMAVSLGCCALIAVGAVIAATAYGSLGIACVAAAGTALHGMLCLILVRRRHGIWINASLVGLKRTYQTMRNLRTCRQVS